MGTNILLTEQPVGTLAGDPTDWATEKMLQTALQVRAESRLKRFVHSGLDVSSVSGLDILVSAGFAVINGFVINIDNGVNLTMAAGPATYRLWLQLQRTSGLVSGVTWRAISINDNPPVQTTDDGDSVLVGWVPMGASSPSAAIQSAAKAPGNNSFSYVGNGAGSRFHFLGATPKLVLVEAFAVGPSPPATDIFAISGGVPGAGANGFFARVIGGTGSTGTSRSATTRPQISTFGFTVDGNLNSTGVTYNCVVFF